MAVIGEAYSLAPGSDVDATLDALLAAENDDSLLERLDDLSGRFALILVTDRARRLFHDPIGSRSIYYRATGELGFSSHAELVARAFGDPRDKAVQSLLRSDEYRSRTVSYLPGDLTVYGGVHGLAPNNYYDLDARRTVRYWPRDVRRKGGFDEFFKALDVSFAALGSHLAQGHAPILGVTAGIDTRTMMAALRAHRQPFRGMTWLRPHGAAARERELTERLAERLEIERTTLELGPLDKDGKAVAAVARRNAGGFSPPSRIVGHMHADFFEPGATFVRGWGAEIVRGFYNVSPGRQGVDGSIRGRAAATARRLHLVPTTRKVAIRSASAPDLLRAYSSSMRGQHPGGEYTRFGLATFERFMERANFDERLERTGFDLSDLFYWEHRMGMWGAAKHNEMDAAALSLAGFNSRRAYEAAFGLDRRKRLTKELLREVISRYDPALADLPYV